MMTSSNGRFFRDTGPLCGEFTGRHRHIMYRGLNMFEKSTHGETFRIIFHKELSNTLSSMKLYNRILFQLFTYFNGIISMTAWHEIRLLQHGDLIIFRYMLISLSYMLNYRFTWINKLIMMDRIHHWCWEYRAYITRKSFKEQNFCIWGELCFACCSHIHTIHIPPNTPF